MAKIIIPNRVAVSIQHKKIEKVKIWDRNILNLQGDRSNIDNLVNELQEVKVIAEQQIRDLVLKVDSFNITIEMIGE